MTYHVAIDIGASSGRVMLAYKEEGLHLEENPSLQEWLC